MLTMEVDTGATLSLISHATYQKFWLRKDTFDAPSLQKTTATLKPYTGVQVKVLGSLQVDVTYQDQETTLTLLVVAGDVLSLLSWDWLKHIRFD